MNDNKPSAGNDPIHVTKMKMEVKRAQEQVKRVKDVDYHKYNQFVVNKGLEINKELRKDLNEKSNKRVNDAAYEAAVQISKVTRSGGSFFFEGLDKLFDKD